MWEKIRREHEGQVTVDRKRERKWAERECGGRGKGEGRIEGGEK